MIHSVSKLLTPNLISDIVEHRLLTSATKRQSVGIVVARPTSKTVKSVAKKSSVGPSNKHGSFDKKCPMFFVLKDEKMRAERMEKGGERGEERFED